MVSLAHHVVSLWFLSCKFPLRKNFVRYIVQGFKNNVLIPCEEGMIAQNPPLVNEDSSSRGRSGSLSSRTAASGGSGASGGPSSRPVSGPGVDTPSKNVQDENRIMFHRELMETCADLMSRYTYGNCSPYAQQSDIVRKLLKVRKTKLLLLFEFNLLISLEQQDGPSQTWLIGHKLVTITTSQCSRVATRRGLCDRCWLLCKLGGDEGSCIHIPNNSSKYLIPKLKKYPEHQVAAATSRKRHLLTRRRRPTSAAFDGGTVRLFRLWQCPVWITTACTERTERVPEADLSPAVDRWVMTFSLNLGRGTKVPSTGIVDRPWNLMTPSAMQQVRYIFHLVFKTIF